MFHIPIAASIFYTPTVQQDLVSPIACEAFYTEKKGAGFAPKLLELPYFLVSDTGDGMWDQYWEQDDTHAMFQTTYIYFLINYFFLSILFA